MGQSPQGTVKAQGDRGRKGEVAATLSSLAHLLPSVRPYIVNR